MLKLYPTSTYFADTSSPDVKEKEKTEVDTGTKEDKPWQLILYNDEVHSFDEVIMQLIKALQCSEERAVKLTVRAHKNGKTTVYKGEFEECFKRNTILKEIQLITEIKG